MQNPNAFGFSDDDVHAAAHGDSSALDRICSTLFPIAKAKVIAALANRPGYFHAAEDLTQEVMTAVSKGVRKLRNPLAIVVRKYLHETVHHRVQDFWRASARQLPFLEDVRRARGILDETSSYTRFDRTGIRDVDAGPATRVNRAELFARVMLSVGQLPANYREAIELAFFDQLETREIAELLGVSRNAAAMRVSRALAELRIRTEKPPNDLGSEI